jgi:acyl-CoA synthetase (AMP-forming)/AMP-acid ligase II
VTEALSVFENLQDISVYGVALPRHEGRAGCAAIVIKPGTTFNFEEFTAFAKSLLPKYAVPLFIRVLDKMPTTENNKLMKGPLKKEGVDPAKLPETASIFWLKGGYAAANTYVPFTASDWESLSQGKASL